MKQLLPLLFVGFAATLLGCRSTLPSVDVTGSPASLTQMRGEWLGTYSSDDTGRRGSIAFILNPAADSAMGDVLMVDEYHDWTSHDPDVKTLETNHSERLSISFVRVAEGEIVGKLDPYADPDCGCELSTVFRGTIDGDKISGTFTSRHGMSESVDEGVWSVQRRERTQAPSRQESVAAKGAMVMPFDLDRTTHLFEMLADGGRQAVISDDDDTEQIGLIRRHLAEEAEKSRHGDFEDPAAIHGEDMAGLQTLANGYDKMTIKYEEVEAGAQIVYRSDEPALVHAIHAWFEQQLADHGSHATDGMMEHKSHSNHKSHGDH